MENQAVCLVQFFDGLFFSFICRGIHFCLTLHALDVVCRKARRGFDFDLLLFSGTLILGRYIQDSVCINVEGYFNLRHSSLCWWNVRKLESTDRAVVLCHRALALKDVQVYCWLVVRCGREYFRLLGRDGGVGFDQLGEYTAHSFDT